MKIENNEYYSLAQIIEYEFIPWIKSIPTLRKWVRSHHSVFNAVMNGTGIGKRYLIKGSNILEFMKLSNQGKLDGTKTH